MPNLTIIYYTANRISDYFADACRRQLLKAIGDTPLISLSKKPINFGTNIVDSDSESSAITIYKVILNGAKMAKTKYIALAEDDALYPEEHFTTFLPPEDTFAYNMSRWSIYSWSVPPIFSLKRREILATMIAPREALIENIEARFAHFPDTSKIPSGYMVEPGRGLDRRLGAPPAKKIDFYSKVPVIVFSHETALGFASLGKRKALGELRAIEIPYWGTAERVMKDFYRK